MKGILIMIFNEMLRYWLKKYINAKSDMEINWFCLKKQG